MPEKELFELIQISLGEKPFKTGKILKLLENKNSLVKRSALELIRDHYCFDLTGKVLKLLFDPDKKIRDIVVEILQLDPFFAFEKRQEFGGVKITTSNKGIYLEKLFSSRRITELSTVVKGVRDSDFSNFIEDFARIPGVENLDMDFIFIGSKKKFREKFDKYRQLYFKIRYPPQVSLAPSYRCNLDCYYCFAHDLNRVFPKDMTLKQFKILLDIVNPGNVIKRVGILGGEPLIFPEINLFIDELKKREMGFYFATNGIVETTIFDNIISHQNLLTVTVHIERDDFYSHSQLKKLLNNVKRMGEKKIEVVIRYNLLKPSQRNWNFLEKYMNLLSDFKFSFAVVFPSQSGHLNTVELDKLKDFSAKIISLLTFLKNKNITGTFHSVFAKPFPPCAFSEEEFKFILKNAEYKNICELDKNQYTNNICINPDLSFFSCMALTDQKYRGGRILPLEEMKIKNRSLAGFLVKTPIIEDCRNCRLFELGVCQAACYSYVE